MLVAGQGVKISLWNVIHTFIGCLSGTVVFVDINKMSVKAVAPFFRAADVPLSHDALTLKGLEIRGQCGEPGLTAPALVLKRHIHACT